MEIQFQLASEKDLPRLLELMHEFYQDQGMAFDEEVARNALRKSFVEPALGSAYLILANNDLAGYFALTACFSLEFHGRIGLLDELYVREPFRKQHLGRAAIEFVQEICKKTGIKALRLEVGEKNRAAQALYNSLGFKRDIRYLFTKWL